MTSQLPGSLTTFIGRRRELTEIGRLLRATRLLTLVGAGGCGKTRLAIEAVGRQAARTGANALFIDLAPLARDEEVAEAAAHAVGVRQPPGQSPTQAIIRWAAARDLTLILDNCEHVIAGCARFATDVLAGTAAVRIVATSREPLDVIGELTWRVPSLTLPMPTDDVGGALRTEAITLFIDRARLRNRDFRLETGNLQAVVTICRELDGIPLAIELAAARLRDLTPAQIADRLDECLSLLVQGGRVSVSRQRTLRGAVDWSYALLSADERRLFRRLAVFNGGFSDAGVLAVAAIPERDALDLLSALVEKSLVQADAHPTVRYALLETLRQYGMERLRESGEMDLTEQLRADHVLELAEGARAGARTAQQADGLLRVDRERDNVRGALDWLTTHDPTKARRLTVAVAEMWGIRGRAAEARRWLVSALEGSPGATAERFTILWHVAWLANRQQDYEAARAAAREAAVIAAERADAEAEGNASQQLGLIARNQGDFVEAHRAFEVAVTMLRSAGRSAAVALGLRGHARGYLGDVDGALDDLRESLLLLDGPDASPRNRGYSLVWSADLAIKRGDDRVAADYIEDAIHIFRTQDDLWVLGLLLDAAAHLAISRGVPDRALRLAGAAESLRESIGGGPPPVFAMNDRGWIAPARVAVGRRAPALWAEGRRLTVAGAIDLAIAAQTRDGRPSPLSPREREVAVLVSEGLTSRQIGERLFISERTAANHVEHIRLKLDVRSRAQIARWVAQEGDSPPIVI